MIRTMTTTRWVAAAALAAVTLTTGTTAAAQQCRAPVFETIRLAQSAAATPVRVSNLMRIELPGHIERLSFGLHDWFAKFKDGGSLFLTLDDASVAHRNNGVTAKAGPLLYGMFNGSTADGCVLLPTFSLDRHDYRVKFVRGKLSVFAYGTGATHNFFVVHATKPDIVVGGLAKDMDRQAFFDLISTIQPPELE